MELGLGFFIISKSRSGGAQKLPRTAIWKLSKHLRHVTALADADFEKMRPRHFVGIYWLLKQVTNMPSGRSLDAMMKVLGLRRTISRATIGSDFFIQTKARV